METERHLPPSVESKEVEEKKEREASFKIEVEVIEEKLNEILALVNNNSEIRDSAKKGLINKIETRTDEIRVRIKTMLKEFKEIL